jgi:6,7-dimethyl-8-ribityllumazine synthase
MNAADRNLSSSPDKDLPDVKKMTFAIVVSDYNKEITQALLEGCKETLFSCGVTETQLEIVHVPGAYELPGAARMVDDKFNPDAVICLGCVIEGETKHNEYINHAVATGMMQLSVLKSKPFVFGVLTPGSREQALERAGGKLGNKGVEAAHTALQMATLKRGLTGLTRKIGF